MPSLIRERAASTPGMMAAFGDRSLIAAALAFEAALARAEAAEGLIPQASADAIAETCGAIDIPVEALAEEAAHAGTLAIALVARLRAAVPPEAAAHVHRGATSQDVADTALMLQAKTGLGLIEADAARLTSALARLAAEHAGLAMTARTLLQPARATTFGLKAANWLVALDHALARLRREAGAALRLQLGGAAGTRDSLGGRGVQVAARMAEALRLGSPEPHWQARRGDVAGLASALAILAGEIGKIARDVSLMAQGEVGEASEPLVAGRGGSSAMAHKRNPAGCQVALSAALRAPHLAASIVAGLAQEHERGLGGWQAEAPVLAELFLVTHGAAAAMGDVIDGLELDPAAMARNLKASGIDAGVGEAQAMTTRILADRRDG